MQNPQTGLNSPAPAPPIKLVLFVTKSTHVYQIHALTLDNAPIPRTTPASLVLVRSVTAVRRAPPPTLVNPIHAHMEVFAKIQAIFHNTPANASLTTDGRARTAINSSHV